MCAGPLWCRGDGTGSRQQGTQTTHSVRFGSSLKVPVLVELAAWKQAARPSLNLHISTIRHDKMFFWRREFGFIISMQDMSLTDTGRYKPGKRHVATFFLVGQVLLSLHTFEPEVRFQSAGDLGFSSPGRRQPMEPDLFGGHRADSVLLAIPWSLRPGLCVAFL